LSVFELVTDVVSIRDVVRRLRPDAEPTKQGNLDVYECLTGGHVDEWPSWADYGDHYHCFSCKDHGDAVSLFAVLKGVDNGVEAAYLMAQEFKVELPQIDPSLREILAERRRAEDEVFDLARGYHTNLQEDPAATRYLEERGISEDLRARFLIGVLGDGSGITIPYFDRRKRPQSIITRNFDGDPTYQYWPVEQFVGGRRGLMVFGGLPQRGTVPIVEGPFDALAVAAAGGCAIALGGSSISESQMRDLEGIVSDRKKLKFVTFLDADPAGVEASLSVAKRAYPHIRYARTDHAELVEGATDPGDLLRDGGPEKVAEGVGRAKKEGKDLAIVLTERIVSETEDELERFEEVVDEVLPLVARHEREGNRHVLARTVANMIGTNLVQDVNKALKDAVKVLLAERARSAYGALAQKTGRSRRPIVVGWRQPNPP
jgi:DNA primase